MPRTVEDGFEVFHERIKHSKTESDAARDHRKSIEACLKNNFGLNRFYRIGSFGNGTNVSNYSDVDYLACLHSDQLTQHSGSLLAKVRLALDRRFPGTGVNVDTPAVVAPFGTAKSETTEVVPAGYAFEERAFKVYKIAAGDGRWMRTSPDAHKAYVDGADSLHNGKVKPLIRFIKAWKFYRSVPISSFYLELYVARYAQAETSIVYHADVQIILSRLNSENVAPIDDPMGVSGKISPCESEAGWLESLSKTETAATRAENARSAGEDGRIERAYESWRILFNDKFPAFGS